MAQHVYAVPSDLAGEPWNVDLDETAAASLLRRASTVVDGLTVTARYAVDGDGYPTDLDTSDALRDATCAQAVWFDETGDTSGAEGRFQSMSLGSASLTKAGAGSSTGASGTAESRISPEAVTILAAAGLTGQAPRPW
ncbi:hypothetical protein [Cellulomonas sp. RIT-PI-Y]|uniref:hypothetical protein n=1 Tax=Cellulomonas sp. RIT-PI-Y TaxID=3035297 RepID=UPI0021D9DAA5|nr:hypothetical protein [Cellulomonas sp. RIT-PI-Y]